jgi:DNA-binding winged helix-turn-helix (wHTH) protein
LVYESDGWRFDLASRELRANGVTVPIGDRAFSILEILVRAAGALVTKHELMSHVWPGVIVEDNTLQVHIAALRKVLGADRILLRTASGRGYRLLGDWSTGVGSTADPAPEAVQRSATPAAARDAGGAPTNLPETVSALIGRDAELDDVVNLVRAGRLVTLSGAGGIGKTRLVLAVARRLLPQFPDGVWFAEFSSLTDPGLVPATIAAAVGLDIGGGEVSAQRLAQALAARRMLLVLDTCEHVIDAVATIAEAVLRAGRRFTSSPPAVSRCGRKGNGSIPCRRSLSRPKMRRT